MTISYNKIITILDIRLKKKLDIHLKKKNKMRKEEEEEESSIRREGRAHG